MAAMITLYKKPRQGGSTDSNGSDNEQIVPAGVPYLTKRNGKFLWVRSKQPKRLEVATDLLKSFGGSKTVRKRSKSVQEEPGKIPLLVGGDAFVPPGLQSQNTAPLPQSTFASPSMSSSFPQQSFGSPSIQPPFPYPPFIPQYAHYYPPQPLPPPPQQMIPAYRVYDPIQDTVSNTNNDHTAAINATHEDLDRLKKVDAHFRKVSMDQTKTKPGDVNKEKEEPKATAGIQKHVCANCGNLRSRMYHHKNPIKPGETPTPSYCGKCQKDDTSCSESETERESRKKAKEEKAKNDSAKEGKPKKEKVKRDSKQPTVESSSESETAKPHKTRAEPVIKETSRIRTYKDEYIIVEEETSEDDQGHRGRSHKREHDKLQKPVESRHEDHDQHRSSYQAPSSRGRSASQSRNERYEPQQPPRRRHRRQDSNHSRQSAISYRHVSASKHKEPERVRESYPQKIRVHYEEQEYSPDSASRSSSSRKHYAAPSQQSYQNPRKVPVRYDEQEYSPDSASRSRSRSRSPSSKKRYAAPSQQSYHEPKKVPVHFSEQEYPQVFESRSKSPIKQYTAPSSEQSCHDPRRYRKSSVSTMAEWIDESQYPAPSWKEYTAAHSARRSPVGQENSFNESVLPQGPTSQCRPARRTSPQSTASPWDEPHDLRTGSNVEEIVVTERFVYRKEKMSEEERRRQEALDTEMLNFNIPRRSFHNLSAKDEASKYYTDDWIAEEELAKRREVAEVNYGSDDGWRELRPEDEHIPGAWPEGEVQGSTWNYSAPTGSGWSSKKMEPGSWRRDNWQDAELVDDDNWSDTESWKALQNEKRLIHVVPKPEYRIPEPTDSYSEPSVSFEKRRSRWANEYETSPFLAADETPRRISRSHEPVYERDGEYKSPRAASYTPPAFSPHVTFGSERVSYFDDGTPDRSREGYEGRSEISGMTEAEREVERRGIRRERREKRDGSRW